MTDLDARLAEAIERWLDAHRDALLTRNVAVSVDGPHQPDGAMDPVYLLRLNGAVAEAEATLFEGGLLLLAMFDKARQTTRESHVETATEEQVGEALTLLAQGW